MVLAVATQAQWANYGYGLGGYYGGFGGYYPFGGAQLATTYAAPHMTTAYAGVPAAAAVPFYGYPSVASTRYHAQDELGQSRFGYAHPGQAATNYRDALGNQIGSYAYFNPEGKEVRVSYTADSRGFRVLSNDLPVAPVANLVAPVQVQDTPEVAAAKATHMAALNAARTGVVAPVVGLPAPVQDTPEVAAAKAEHAVKFAAAKAAATPVSRAKRQVFSYNTPLAYGSSPLAYTYGATPYGATPYGYNYGSHLGYNAAAVGYGTPFGYNYAHPLAYNQLPYNFNFGAVPYVTPVAASTTTA